MTIAPNLRYRRRQGNTKPTLRWLFRHSHRMWRRFRNLVLSISTYADLSPDLAMRRRINQQLHDRPALTMAQWHEQFCHTHDIARSVSDFVYDQLSDYSGIDFSRVQPGDRLIDTLELPLVCWFDWEQCLWEDFRDYFGVDLSWVWDFSEFETVEDILVFLHNHAASQPTR